MMKKLNSILFHRSVTVGVSLLIQVLLLAAMILRFSEYTAYFYSGCVLISFLAMLWILSRRMEPGYKIAWLILILLMPVFGGIFYLLIQFYGTTSIAPAMVIATQLEQDTTMGILHDHAGTHLYQRSVTYNFS